MTTRNKVGFFGGTFNPVHKAHVETAELFINHCALDRLYIIPNNIPPLKESHGVSAEDRINMLEIAFRDTDRIIISDMEIRRGGTSYTFETIDSLKKIEPESELYMLMGDDWIDNFDKWKNYKYILENVSLVVASRESDNLIQALDRFEAKHGVRPKLLGNKVIELSSSLFRENKCSDYLPDGVFEYIKNRRLYGI